MGRHNIDVGATQLKLGRRNLGRQGNGATQPDTSQSEQESPLKKDIHV